MEPLTSHFLRAVTVDRAPTNPSLVLVSQLAAASLHLAWSVGRRRRPLVQTLAVAFFIFFFSSLSGWKGAGPSADWLLLDHSAKRQARSLLFTITKLPSAGGNSIL